MSGGDRSRQLGRLLMAGALLQMLLFLIGVSSRSYLVVALPVGAGLAVVSALAFWVGYTMAFAEWDDEPFPEPGPEALANTHETATTDPPEPVAAAEPEESYGAGG